MAVCPSDKQNAVRSTAEYAWQLSFKLRNHPSHDGFERGQMNRCDFPKLLIVKVLVLVPQDISERNDRGPRCLVIPSQVISAECLRSLGNNLRCPLDRPAVNIAGPVLFEGKAFNRGSYAFDLVANVKQPGTRAFGRSHQKTRRASRSTSLRM
jgi:hypothetical protein